MAGSGGSGEGAGWRVFVSHTSELRDFPHGNSYVAAAERAVSAAGHVIVEMADFPAANQPPAQLCIDRVRGCDVYVGLLGTRYGSPVRDRPEVSYTELEFDTATEAGLARLVFLLDTGAADTGIPVSALIDREFGARQDTFRRRVQDSGLVTGSFANPDMLGHLVERSLGELAKTRRRAGGKGGGSQVPPVVVVGEIPQAPLGFQPRADLHGRCLHFAAEKLRHRRPWLRTRHEYGGPFLRSHRQSTPDQNLRARCQSHARRRTRRRPFLHLQSEQSNRHAYSPCRH